MSDISYSIASLRNKLPACHQIRFTSSMKTKMAEGVVKTTTSCMHSLREDCFASNSTISDNSSKFIRNFSNAMMLSLMQFVMAGSPNVLCFR